MACRLRQAEARACEPLPRRSGMPDRAVLRWCPDRGPACRASPGGGFSRPELLGHVGRGRRYAGPGSGRGRGRHGAHGSLEIQVFRGEIVIWGAEVWTLIPRPACSKMAVYSTAVSHWQFRSGRFFTRWIGLMFDQIEKLKREYTDKYVVVDAAQPELARFNGFVGQVKTVNMNGRALVQFDAWLNIGWYDIDPSYLKVVPKPEPDAEKKHDAARQESHAGRQTCTGRRSCAGGKSGRRASRQTVDGRHPGRGARQAGLLRPLPARRNPARPTSSPRARQTGRGARCGNSHCVFLYRVFLYGVFLYCVFFCGKGAGQETQHGRHSGRRAGQKGLPGGSSRTRAAARGRGARGRGRTGTCRRARIGGEGRNVGCEKIRRRLRSLPRRPKKWPGAESTIRSSSDLSPQTSAVCIQLSIRRFTDGFVSCARFADVGANRPVPARASRGLGRVRLKRPA